MSTKQALRQWAVVLGTAAVIATGGAAPSLARTDATAEATPEPTTASTCPSAEYPAVGAVNITDGAVRWLACSPDEAYRTIIGASDDVVLVEESGPMGSSPVTIAFDAADWSERWRRSTADTPTPPGPVDGQGIVVLTDRDAPGLVGVDPVTGDERWRVASSEAPLAHSSTVAVVWDVVSTYESSRFRGIDRATGGELWVSNTPLSDQSGVFVARSPAAVLGEVVVVPTGATVTAIDMRTGGALWQAPRLDHLAAADGVVVGVRGAGGPPTSFMVTALDAASGQQLWTGPGFPSYGGLLAVGDGVIVVRHADRPGLVAYEVSSGDERWSAAQPPPGEPQIINGTSLVLLWEGTLAVVSTADGATVWSATQPFGSPLMNSTGSNGDAVFVAINSLPWRD